MLAHRQGRLELAGSHCAPHPPPHCVGLSAVEEGTFCCAADASPESFSTPIKTAQANKRSIKDHPQVFLVFFLRVGGLR